MTHPIDLDEHPSLRGRQRILSELEIAQMRRIAEAMQSTCLALAPYRQFRTHARELLNDSRILESIAADCEAEKRPVLGDYIPRGR